MEKQKLDLTSIKSEYATISYAGVKVKVKKYIDIADKFKILSAYFEENTDVGVNRHVINNGSLIASVIDVMTDIDITELDFDLIISSGLWLQIVSNITNYKELDRDIDRIISQESVESKLGKLIDKVDLFFEKLSSIDVSGEGLKKLLEEIKPATDELKKYYPTIPSDDLKENK